MSRIWATMLAVLATVTVTAALALLGPTAAQAAPPPAIAWSPTTTAAAFDYGSVDPGQTDSQTFTLTNSGGSATGALSVSLTGSSTFSVTGNTCTATAVGPRKSCVVTVQFAPTTAGQTTTATLTASAKKPAASATITLTGTGTGTPHLTISPGEFVETLSSGADRYRLSGVVVQDGDRLHFTVMNDGTASTGDLSWLTLNTSWREVGGTCGLSPLAPTQTCTIVVTWLGFADNRCTQGNSTGEALTLSIRDVARAYIQLLGPSGTCPVP